MYFLQDVRKTMKLTATKRQEIEGTGLTSVRFAGLLLKSHEPTRRFRHWLKLVRSERSTAESISSRSGVLVALKPTAAI